MREHTKDLVVKDFVKDILKRFGLEEVAEHTKENTGKNFFGSSSVLFGDFFN